MTSSDLFIDSWLSTLDFFCCCSDRVSRLDIFWRYFSSCSFKRACFSDSKVDNYWLILVLNLSVSSNFKAISLTSLDWSSLRIFIFKSRSEILSCSWVISMMNYWRCCSNSCWASFISIWCWVLILSNYSSSIPVGVWNPCSKAWIIESWDFFYSLSWSLVSLSSSYKNSIFCSRIADYFWC